MKPFTKLILLTGLFTLFLGYSFAQIPTISGQILQPKQRSLALLQKSGTKLPCELESGFQDKITRIKEMSANKIMMLDKVDSSLDGIIPLVKNFTIKTTLQTKQQAVQTMQSNYITLKSRIEKNPKSICGKPPVWKTYNEETKIMVEDIRQQFRLLKK